MFNIIAIVLISLVLLSALILGYAHWEKYKQDQSLGYIEKEWHDKDEL